MYKSKVWALAVLFSLLFSAVSFASQAPGDDKAPALQTTKWLRGQDAAKDVGNGKNVTVVVFWATWCEACKSAIPVLTELQNTYKKQGLSIVALADEDPARVKRFLKLMGSDISFAVALDDGSKTTDAYRELFPFEGIPFAFVVGKNGNIIWKGNPLDNLQGKLEKIMSGDFSLEEEENAERAHKLLAVYLYLANETDEVDLAQQMHERIMKYGGNNIEFLDHFALATALMVKPETRDLQLALSTAKRAYDLSSGTNASVLDTYAIVLYEAGEITEALNMQVRAVKLDPDGDGYLDRLEKYKAQADLQKG